MEQSFLDKLERIVEDNLNNEQFGVVELAGEVSLSRFQVHRKLQAITGQSASRFIREVRLKWALELLKKTNSTATDIAYQVGFGSATYFNKCFNEYYGITPGEVKNSESFSVSNDTVAPAITHGSDANSKQLTVDQSPGIRDE